MGEVSTIGLDIAKSVFQVHGVDGSGAVVILSLPKTISARSDGEVCLAQH